MVGNYVCYRYNQKVIKTGLFKMTVLTSLVSDSIVDTFVVVYKFAFDFNFHFFTAIKVCCTQVSAITLIINGSLQSVSSILVSISV